LAGLPDSFRIVPQFSAARHPASDWWTGWFPGIGQGIKDAALATVTINLLPHPLDNWTRQEVVAISS
jgi:hypothetical protein